MVKFLIIGNANATTYKEIFPYFVDGTMHCRTNTGKCSYVMHFNTKDELKKIPSLWYTNIDISNLKQKLVLTKTYDPDKYPKYDNYDAIEVGCVKDIPKDYYGVMGVPMSILLFDLNDIEILGITENAEYLKPLHIEGCEKYDRPYINGKRMYSRVLIKRQFEIVDARDYALTNKAKNSAELSARGFINGKEIYKRILIKWLQ